METEILNPAPILTDLVSRMQVFDLSDNIYLSHLKKSDQVLHAFGMKEVMLPEILQILGIRSMTISGLPDLSFLENLHISIPNAVNEQYPWRYLRNDKVISELQTLFQNCRTIAFDDWSNVSGASDLWNGLLSDIIKPVGKQDIEFVFYLGDCLQRISFEVDEAIDIISDFSRYGKVTFALDIGEAIKLWMVLNGMNLAIPLGYQNFSDLKKKCLSIFKTMNIERLLVYSANKVILFTKEQQFVLFRRTIDHNTEISSDAHQNFIAGFSIGLVLHLDIVQCIALGLIVFGSSEELESRPERKDLIAYIYHWIEELQNLNENTDNNLLLNTKFN